MRRARRRIILEQKPSNRALIVRVVFYVILLVFVLIFQDKIGRAGANCMAMFE